jgi:G3E family GTPase
LEAKKELMNTEIYIVAGFLGAGKTTLIQKLLKEAFQGSKVALVENDFGEVSVDAALLKSGGVEVKEINSGCVCCTLQGDFIQAARELMKRFSPDKILIEPSGVSKLSDVAEACLDPGISAVARIAGKITVVDVKRCQLYLENFGEFFEDQIKSADVVVLARTQVYPDKVAAACELIRSLNERAVIVSLPWEQISARDVLDPGESRQSGFGNAGGRGQEQARGDACEINHSMERGHAHDHNHDHTAEDVFDSVTITTERVFALEDLKTRIAQMERSTKGAVIRAKGVLRGKDGYWNVQYLPGDLQIESCPAEGNVLCVIGQDLNGPELAGFFGGAV